MENKVNRSACMQCQIKCNILGPFACATSERFNSSKKNWADMTERASELVKAILAHSNEQKNFADKLPFLSRLAQHTLKLLARISLRDVRNLC